MVLEAQSVSLPEKPACQVFLGALGDPARQEAFRMAHDLRLSGIRAACDINDRGLKAQMKYADKIGAAYSLVLGDNELESGTAMLKNMKTGEKREVFIGDGFPEQFAAIEAEEELRQSFPGLQEE